MKHPLILGAALALSFGGSNSVKVQAVQTTLTQPFHAATPTTPKPGSALRKNILDALRPPVTKFNNGQRVTFTSVDLRTQGSWAYVEAATVDSKGKRLGPPFTNLVSALLHKTGSTWHVTEWAYAGDMISLDWEKKYPQVPRALWPQHRGG